MKLIKYSIFSVESRKVFDTLSMVLILLFIVLTVTAIVFAFPSLFGFDAIASTSPTDDAIASASPIDYAKYISYLVGIIYSCIAGIIFLFIGINANPPFNNIPWEVCSYRPLCFNSK